ncbi:MAG TPA: sn-glycerol-3-phosphate ABC transporter ATP-binding protein UgpC [Chloroflexota bacterium]|nr:sn-glycerol-3-phosphate ABC transporter ATP-binding protein UgpC [Chloroflexota bacterium]
MASVTYDRVTKRFGADTVAVRDFSLEVRDGECLILVGPSGCGKSTSLRMLAGLEDVSEGAIFIGDRLVNNVAPSERDIAMVFQNYALYPHMSVFDNIGFGLRMRKVPRAEIERKVNEVAGMLGLERLLDRKPRQLSGGQRQRVALGRAIARQPQVFLFDEPLSNLDAALRAETRIHLQRLHRELGTTFFYVTHDQVEAMTMGDRIAVMREGTLQQVASPRELYDHPRNTYVAAFIGHPRMNLLPVTISDRVVRADGLELTLPYALPAGQAVLGIRPEDMSLPVEDGAETLRLAVDIVECLGSDQYLYGKVGSVEVIARTRPDLTIVPGEVVELGVNLSRIHIFDAQTGEAVAFPSMSLESAASG